MYENKTEEENHWFYVFIVFKVNFYYVDNVYLGILLIIVGILYAYYTFGKRESYEDLSVADWQDIVSSWIAIMAFIGFGLAITIRNA